MRINVTTLIEQYFGQANASPADIDPRDRLGTGYRPDTSTAGNPHAVEGRAGMTHKSPHWKSTHRDPYGLMITGENLRGRTVMQTIRRYDADIKEAAARFGVDENLIKATIYEEQTHLEPFENEREYWLGIGNTVGLGQMTVGNHGYTREQLFVPRNNIFAIAEHYSKMNPSLSIQQKARTYNGSGPKAELYGYRVLDYYRAFVRESK